MAEFRFIAYSDFELSANRSQNLFSLPLSPFQPTKRTTTDEISHELNVPYTIFEVLVAMFAVVGNLMVIIVFRRERKLRRRTNYYIVSLAIADFLVGSLAVPFAVLASIGLPTNLYACLFSLSLLVVLCTISIFCLVAVSVDRYWAILYPMAYSRNVRTKTAIVIILLCWFAGFIVGFLPLFGWHADVGPNQACLFVEVMDYNYLVFLYFATIITPALLMVAFYAHIYTVIVKQVRQIVTMNPVGDISRRSSTAQIPLPTPTSSTRPCHGGTMLRVLGPSRKREVKATQNLSIIVLFFMFCWFPLYTINCIQAFCPDCFIHPKLTLFCIILSHLNSAVNPVLYAYHLKDFRAALKNLILRMMGVEVEPQVDPMHRFSLASQHRLQSMDANIRNSMQPRIYIDSPIWLRQQQQQSVKNLPNVPKCGVISPCLNNINQTVAAVAAMTPDMEREIWNIMEASSGAEIGEISYEFPSNKDSNTPTPPPRQHRRYSRKLERSDSPYSYDNRNYSSGRDELDYDEVFLPNTKDERLNPNELNNTLIACSMREKLRSDTDTDYHNQMHSSQLMLTDSSFSDNEHPRQPGNSKAPLSPKSDTRRLSNSSPSLESAAIYVIDQDCTAPAQAPSHKPRFKKSVRASNNVNSKTARTRRKYNNTNTETPTPNKETPSSPVAATATTKSVAAATNTHSNSNGSSSLTSTPVIGYSSNNNNNAHNINNLNYYTFHHTQSQQHESQHQQSHTEKFSPLRAVTNFIFPPIKAKHSSLFQLFHPCPTSPHSEEARTSEMTNTTTTPLNSTPSTAKNESVLSGTSAEVAVDSKANALAASSTPALLSSAATES